MKCIALLYLFALCTADIPANTHWMVTETGLIQPRVDSPFEMARPYDLLAFLNQDTRWENIMKFYDDLSKRQIEINKAWSFLERETDINMHLNSDDNCLKAGPLNRLDWYYSRLEEGLSRDIEQEEFNLYIPPPGKDTDVPDCKKISSLTFSMSAFEHLEGMINRHNLSINAELYLPDLIAPVMTVEQFGHWASAMLKKNSTSWLHYNMASLYWRVRGNALKALECSRRAVHYAPRVYKNVALLSMGTVLHRAKRPLDAIVVLSAAVDHASECIYAHFTLANALAIAGEFNSSVTHYDICLKKEPEFVHAFRNRHGVLCIEKIMKKMKSVHKSLAKLRSELIEFAQREALWLKSQAAFLRTMKHDEEFDYRNVEKIVEKMTEITGLNIKDLKKDGDRNSLMQYFLDGPLYDIKWSQEKGVNAIEVAFNLQRLVKQIAKHSSTASDFVVQPDLVKVTDGKLAKEAGAVPAFPETHRVIRKVIITEKREETKPEAETSSPPATTKATPTQQNFDFLDFEVAVPYYPNDMKINRMREDFDREMGWPSDKLCKEHGAFDKLEVIYPVFLPFENKGLRLRGLLTDRISVPANVEHELPWHPPVCPGEKGVQIPHKKNYKQQTLPEVMDAPYLKHKLLEYVGDGHIEKVIHMQYAEIGQRLQTAMQMNVAPKWILYTLTSLYWRVRGNKLNALSCLLSASKHVQREYRDVVLTSLASVYLETGFVEEAVRTADEAFKLGLYEPATNFVLASLSMLKKHRNTQLFHLKQVVRVEPRYLHGGARALLLGSACLVKHLDALHELDFPSDGAEICTQMEPNVGMLCKKDGRYCRVSNVQCFLHHSKDSASTLYRLMEIKKPDPVEPDETDLSVFDPFIMNMPIERTDKKAHEENYKTMMDIMGQLRGCGPKGCSTITSEDLALNLEDCSHQYLQLGYWIQITSFRQLLSDSELRLPPEIATQTPSSKKLPECRVQGDPTQDFFVERMLHVTVDGWEPVLSIMHQFAEIFEMYDYIALGAKIAKYVDSKPQSFLGLLGAGWWCGASGRGACAARCLAAAHLAAPPLLRPHAARSLAALLHLQSKHKDAQKVAFLSFYTSPQSKLDAFLVATSHSFMREYEQAIWMYRYVLTFDEKYLPAKACLHATMCMMLFGDLTKPNAEGVTHNAQV